VAADRSGCRRSFPADLELAREQLLHASVIHDQHDQVDAFYANLKTRASAADRDESWSAPPFCCTTGRYTAAMLAAEDEPALHQMWNHGNALGIVENLFRYPFVGRGRHLAEYVSGHLQGLGHILFLIAGPSQSS
jgi:alkanesulfonate monooxygenase SsuD/methylene tetrahydromethanopterin reductase-like flavin-dependent oxidoreductase (luciferase family)